MFPDPFWNLVEEKEKPSLEIRVSRMTKHFNACLSMPGLHLLKAVYVDTDEIVSRI